MNIAQWAIPILFFKQGIMTTVKETIEPVKITRQVKRTLPAELQYLLTTINQKYSNFVPGKNALKSLIDAINRDEDIKKLHSWHMIGSIIIIYRNEITRSSGKGKNICIGHCGKNKCVLYMYDWDDYRKKYSISTKFDTKVAKEYNIDYETLRKAIVDYTDLNNYLEYANEFNVEFKEKYE